MDNCRYYQSRTNPNHHIIATRRGSISVVRSGMVATITVYPTEYINKQGTMCEATPKGFREEYDSALARITDIFASAANPAFRAGNGIAALLTDAKKETGSR